MVKMPSNHVGGGFLDLCVGDWERVGQAKVCGAAVLVEDQAPSTFVSLMRNISRHVGSTHKVDQGQALRSCLSGGICLNSFLQLEGAVRVTFLVALGEPRTP